MTLASVALVLAVAALLALVALVVASVIGGRRSARQAQDWIVATTATLERHELALDALRVALTSHVADLADGHAADVDQLAARLDEHAARLDAAEAHVSALHTRVQAGHQHPHEHDEYAPRRHDHQQAA